MESLEELDQGHLSGREFLLDVEKKDGYLFHGSAERIEWLEPCQPYRCDQNTGAMVEDGGPCVSASPFADIAIFRSLINRRTKGGVGWSAFGVRGGKPSLRTTRQVLDTVRGKKVVGWVHILERDQFYQRNEAEWRSLMPVKPISVIRVDCEDLPPYVEVGESHDS
jgi:hypothetical protein